jgi:hypothetical protein
MATSALNREKTLDSPSKRSERKFRTRNPWLMCNSANYSFIPDDGTATCHSFLPWKPASHDLPIIARPCLSFHIFHNLP